MFIATMYSYGNDDDSVGVDGIVGCMGIFVAHGHTLYAIHIPDTPAQFQAGRNAFVNHVALTDPHFNGANAHLYAVMNGGNRSNGYLEVLDYAVDLGIPKITTVRLNSHLGGTNAFNKDSASIVCEFLPGSQNCNLKYKRHGDVTWGNNGTPRAGYYYNNGYTAVLSTVAALGQGWHLVDHSNSTIVEAVRH